MNPWMLCRRLFCVGAVVFIVTGALPAPARADTAGHSPAFSGGTWTLELSGSYADPIRFSEDRMALGTVGVNYYFLNNVSLGFHLSGYGVDQPDDEGYGAGFEGWLRLHLFTFDRFTIFADGGGGRTYFYPEEPAGGSKWNWTAKIGGGVTFQLDENVYLMGGARYFHVSNGNQWGRHNNPSYDAVQYYVGLMFNL
jgi:opacity protein-like surface antigen